MRPLLRLPLRRRHRSGRDTAAPAIRRAEGEALIAGITKLDAAGRSCMQEPRPMLHRHGVQLAARAINRSQARRPLISPSFLAVQETFLTSAVSWRELKGRSPG